MMETIKIYLASELPEPVREYVLDKYGWEVTPDGWAENTISEWNDKLIELGYDNPVIFYDVSYCQGAGSSFTADVDVEKWILAHKAGNELRSLLNVCRDFGGAYGKIQQGPSHYVHEYTMRGWVGLDWMPYSDNEVERHNRAYEQSRQMERWMLDEARELARQIHRDLEKANEYYWDEAVRLDMMDNCYGWHFTVDGQRVWT